MTLHRAHTIYSVLACILVAGVALILSQRYAVNIPLLDDYYLVLDFILEISTSDSWWQQIKLMFAFRNGHPIFTQKLLSLLDYWIFGTVNFKRLIFANNLMQGVLILTVYKILSLYTKDQMAIFSLVLFVGVPIFTLNNWPSSFMHIATVVFSLQSLYHLAQKFRSSCSWALLFAILASLSSGSGILVFFISIPLLIARRSKKELMYWSVGGILVLIFYLLSMSSGPRATSPSASISPVVYVVNLTVYYGAMFDALYGNFRILSPVLGGLISVALLFILIRYRKVWRDYPLLMSGLLWALALGFLTTMLRSQYGLGATTAYRYRFYQSIPLLFIFMACLVFRINRTRHELSLFILISIVLYGLRMGESHQEMKNRSVQLQNGARIYKTLGDSSQLTVRNHKLATDILNKAAAKDIFRMASKPMQVRSITPMPVFPTDLEVQYSREEINDQYFYLEGAVHNQTYDSKRSIINIGIHKNDTLFLFPISPLVKPNDLMPASSNEFSFFLSKRDFAWRAGLDKVYVLISDRRQKVVDGTMVDL